jgi:protein TonB
MGEEGKVILRVLVNPQGTADNVEIKTSSGSQRLDEAQKTVRTLEIHPGQARRRPVQSWVLVPIIFKLEQ